MNSAFSVTGTRPPGEVPPRPPGEMPSIDPSSMDTDETINAIIVRTETGKLTVGRRETRRPTESTPTVPDPAESDKTKGHDR